MWSAGDLSPLLKARLVAPTLRGQEGSVPGPVRTLTTRGQYRERTGVPAWGGGSDRVHAEDVELLLLMSPHSGDRSRSMNPTQIGSLSITLKA
jgi:hypothetical protein